MLSHIFYTIGSVVLVLFLFRRITTTTTRREPRFTFYYVDWCHHCQEAKPEVAKLKAIVNAHGIPVEILAIDASGRSDIQGYPTLIFTSRTGSQTEYTGPRTAMAMRDFIVERMTNN